jgi:tRNA A-37 threonylcarbamoyl transferase component Bud32
MKELCGRHHNIGDLRTCEDTVEQLHGAGVVHGDLNKYNIIVTGDVAKLIDFEVSTFWKTGNHEMEKVKLRKPAEKLLDTLEVILK